MGAEAEQLHAEILDIDGHPTSGGKGIGVERNAFGRGDLGDFLDWLNGADVVVDQVNGDEGGLRRNRGGDVGGIDPPDDIDRDLGDFEAMLGQILDRVHDGGMLDGGDDDVVALGTDVGVGRSP